MRCLLYGLIVSWGMFNSATDGFDSLKYFTTLQLVKLFGNIVFAGFGGVILAFLDQTLSSLTPNKNLTEERPLQ